MESRKIQYTPTVPNLSLVRYLTSRQHFLFVYWVALHIPPLHLHSHLICLPLQINYLSFFEHHHLICYFQCDSRIFYYLKVNEYYEYKFWTYIRWFAHLDLFSFYQTSIQGLKKGVRSWLNVALLKKQFLQDEIMSCAHQLLSSTTEKAHHYLNMVRYKGYL